MCRRFGRRRYGARRMNVIESWAVTHTRIWTSGNRVVSVGRFHRQNSSNLHDYHLVPIPTREEEKVDDKTNSKRGAFG